MERGWQGGREKGRKGEGEGQGDGEKGKKIGPSLFRAPYNFPVRCEVERDVSPEVFARFLPATFSCLPIAHTHHRLCSLSLHLSLVFPCTVSPPSLPTCSISSSFLFVLSPLSSRSYGLIELAHTYRPRHDCGSD